MNVRKSLHVVGLVAAFALPILVFAGTGNLMRITSTTRMSGGPMAMPPRTMTRQQCVADREQLSDPATWDRNSECRARDVHRTATGLTAHLVCRNGDAVLKVEFRPGGGAHGTMHMVTNAGGMSMTMDQTFDAERIGSCDAPAPTH